MSLATRICQIKSHSNEALRCFEKEATRVSLIPLCLRHVSLNKLGILSSMLETTLLTTMGSLGPNGYPQCETCHQLPLVYHSDFVGFVCLRCMQNEDNIDWALYINRKYRSHLYLADPIVTTTMACFILGTGLEQYCQCGRCNPSWFLRGWVCYGDD